ncbi:MAG: histidinol-phosphate transaminase [Calditrichaeota bacterium]|nr:MAG: histidinol-phosphate transaminase [Calditrichota bacterium]
MDAAKYIRPNVHAIKGYHLEKYTCDVKLDQNENPFDLPEDIKDRILSRIKTVEWGRYPDYSSESLTAKIASFAGMKTDEVLVGHGSNSLILSTLLSTISAGDGVVLTSPSFSLYQVFNQILSAQIKTVDLDPNNFSAPMEQLCDVVGGKDVKMTILCSPNNPTGSAFSIEQIENILVDASGLVLVDEAYQEFYQQNLTSLLPKYENLVILRTFSKALSMAGFRVGYLIARKELIASIKKACVPYNINISAQIAVDEILNYPELINERVQTIIRERDRLWTILKKISSVKVYPSKANFFLVRTPDGKKVFNHFLNAGVLVRDVSGYPGLENCIRFNVGTPEENELIVDALNKLDEIL